MIGKDIADYEMKVGDGYWVCIGTGVLLSIVAAGVIKKRVLLIL